MERLPLLSPCTVWERDGVPELQAVALRIAVRTQGWPAIASNGMRLERGSEALVVLGNGYGPCGLQNEMEEAAPSAGSPTLCNGPGANEGEWTLGHVSQL